MDKDRIAGAAHQAKGSVKVAAGKAVGNPDLKAEGRIEKAAGQLQNAAGRAKDAMRDAAKKH